MCCTKVQVKKVLKLLPEIELIFKPELLLFYLNFFTAFKSKGLHMNRNEVFISSFLQIFLDICLILKHKIPTSPSGNW